MYDPIVFISLDTDIKITSTLQKIRLRNTEKPELVQGITCIAAEKFIMSTYHTLNNLVPPKFKHNNYFLNSNVCLVLLTQIPMYDQFRLHLSNCNFQTLNVTQ